MWGIAAITLLLVIAWLSVALLALALRDANAQLEYDSVTIESLKEQADDLLRSLHQARSRSAIGARSLKAIKLKATPRANATVKAMAKIAETALGEMYGGNDAHQG